MLRLRSLSSSIALALILSIAPVQMLLAQPGQKEDIDLPSKWFQKAKGYEQALELQAETGADIFIYFTREAPSDEKGLCRWFESKGLSDVKIRKYLRDYIKVKAPLPSNPDTQKLAEAFEVGKTPAVYIVQPKRRPQKCAVFDWTDKKPKLLSADEMIEVFRVRSSERYQLPSEADTK